MAEQSILMTRNGVTKPVDPKLYKIALDKGWTRAGGGSAPKGVGSQPSTQGMSAEDIASHTSPGGGAAPKTGFMRGLGEGINPMHGAPDNMANPGTMGPVGNFAADAINLRETMNKAQSGDKSGAAGMAVGTGLGLVGPELVKGAGKALKASGLAARAASEVPRLAEAAKRAGTTMRELKGGILESRLGEYTIQPLRKALNAKFEPLHKALENYAVPMSNAMTQIVKRLSQSMDSEAAKAVEGFMKADGAIRSALDYREADKLVSELRSLRDAHPKINTLARLVDGEIDKIAKQVGLDKARTEYKGLYKELMEVRNAVATTAKTKGHALRPIFDMFTGHAGTEAGAATRVGARVAGTTETKLSEVGEAGAKKLAKKLQVHEKAIEQAGSKAREKVGTTLKWASRTAQAATAASHGAKGALSDQDQPSQ